MFERENTTERFFIDAHGADEDALRAGFVWLLGFARDGGHARAAVFVPGLRQVEALGRAIGEQAAKELEKKRAIVVGGVTIDLLIQSKLPFSYQEGPVLAVWVDDKQLDRLDDLRTPALCAIPWNRVDVDGWKTNWNPTDARTGEPGGRDETVSNPVVVSALTSLTARVNVSTGLTHSSDKSAAVEMFRELKKAGEDFDPDEVRAWAVRHGWRPDHARELAELAQKLKDGQRVQVRERGKWRDDIVAIWREDTQKK